MKMKITITRYDESKVEITTGEHANLDEVLKLLTLALQAEGYEYVKELSYNADEEIAQLVNEINGLNKLIDDLEERND